MQYECENVLNDAALMEACGVGLSRTDMYGVMMVCKQLGEDPKLGVATVRFFGKVLLHFSSAHGLGFCRRALPALGLHMLPALAGTALCTYARTVPVMKHHMEELHLCLKKMTPLGLGMPQAPIWPNGRSECCWLVAIDDLTPANCSLAVAALLLADQDKAGLQDFQGPI